MDSNKAGVLLSSGYFMPIIGLGTWQDTDEEETLKAIEAAIDAGYRHIDTAYAYRNEHFIGKALKKILSNGKVARSDLFIVSKLPGFGMREEDVEYFFKKSLTALQLDYIDLYLVHTPLASKLPNRDDDNFKKVYDEKGVFQSDKEVDLVKTWKAMEALVKKSLVRSIGLSNFNSKQIQRIYDNAEIKPSNLQVECHVYLPQYELVEFCKKLNISVTAYAPLGSPGLLPWVEKNFKAMNVTLPNMLEDPKIKSIAEKHNKTTAQVSLRYLIQRNIVVIPKSSKANRIQQNIDVFNFKLSDDDMDVLKSLGSGFRYFSFDMGGESSLPEYPFNEPF